MKVRRFNDVDPNREWYVINCPACGEHTIAVKPPFSNGAAWVFNGNMKSPTFSPSVNISWGKPGSTSVKPIERRCHFFVREGMIEFCADCTHELKGQTVPLLDVIIPKQRKPVRQKRILKKAKKKAKK